MDAVCHCVGQNTNLIQEEPTISYGDPTGQKEENNELLVAVVVAGVLLSREGWRSSEEEEEDEDGGEFDDNGEGEHYDPDADQRFFPPNPSCILGR